MLLDKGLDGRRDHGADFDHQGAAWVEPRGRLFDERCDDVCSIFAGAERDIGFMFADVAGQLLHFGGGDVRRIAHDKIELWFGRMFDNKLPSRNVIRSETPCRSAFRRATASAAGLISIAVI